MHERGIQIDHVKKAISSPDKKDEYIISTAYYL